jgi:hypothetical protein
LSIARVDRQIHKMHISRTNAYTQKNIHIHIHIRIHIRIHHTPYIYSYTHVSTKQKKTAPVRSASSSRRNPPPGIPPDGRRDGTSHREYLFGAPPAVLLLEMRFVIG